MPLTPERWNSITNVNNNLTEDATTPQVVQLSNGNTLIVWASADPTAPTNDALLDLRGQIFDPLGNEIGGEIQLNASRTADQEFQPSVTALPSGGFSVAYLDLDTTVAFPSVMFDTSIVVDTFSNSGVFQNGETLTTGTSSSGLLATQPQIAALRDTNTLTVWYDAVNGDVKGQAYNPTNDNLISTELTVFNGNTGADESVRGLSITALNNNDDYVVVWGN